MSQHPATAQTGRTQRRHEISPLGIIALSIFALMAATLSCGGIGLDYERDLTGDYAVWATDEEEQATVVKKDPKPSSSATGVIGAMVFAYGWNKDFIIAKQHPSIDHFRRVDTNTTNWFILEVATGLVYGPLTEPEYVKWRQRLGVPDSVTFTETVSLD